MCRLNLEEIERIINNAIIEDVGNMDITSELVIAQELEAKFLIKSKSAGIICGTEIGRMILAKFDQNATIDIHVQDGQRVEKGDLVMSGKMNASSFLVVERIMLNIMQNMSGIATFTRQFVNKISSTKAKILDTRKTIPGFRELQKYAVRVGGGLNHRMNLETGILIKDNHISMCGNITNAINMAKTGAPILYKIEVECSDLEQVKEAVIAGADVIMLDNMTVSNVKKSLKLINDRVKTEVSGNIDLDNVLSYAEAGVDFISIGMLTHSPRAIDLSAKISPII